MRWTIFWKDERGGIAIMFGVTLVVLATVVGAAIDYSRATNLRTAYQVAADAAVLAATADPRLEFPERERIAHRVAAANLEKLNVGVNVLVKAHELPSGGVRVEIEGSSVSTIMAAVGVRTTPVRASADAYALLENVEIALVLDLTGSMENDMPTLRRSAEALVRTLLENRSTQNVRISIVPFVAAVNPGRANLPMWMMDSGVNSQHHGRFLRNRATFIWRSGYPTCEPGGAFQDNTGGGSFNDRSSLELFNRSFSSLIVSPGVV